MVIKIHNFKLYKTFLLSIFCAIYLISCNITLGEKENIKEETNDIIEVDKFDNNPTVLPLTTATYSNLAIISPTLSIPELKQPHIQSIQKANFQYVIQSGTPVGIPNFSHPEFGCNWSGVGGQVFNQLGFPIAGLVVEVNGVLNGNIVLGLALTGNSVNIGPGGYEVQLAESAVASHQTLWIQLFDIYGQPLTNKYYFDTYDSCDKNLILINFQESISTTASMFYFPIVFR